MHFFKTISMAPVNLLNFHFKRAIEKLNMFMNFHKLRNLINMELSSIAELLEDKIHLT
jgi:hypothetical protein